MDRITDGNKVKGVSVAPAWRIDFKRMTSTTEVEQWAQECGADRVLPGSPPLFIVGDVDKEAAMREFKALEPVATKVAANDD